MAGLGHVIDFTDLIDFSRRFPGLMVEQLEELQREAHRVMHRRVEELTAQMSPVGSVTRSGKPKFRPGWRSVPANPEAAISSLRPTRVEQTVPHGLVVDLGRKPAAAHQRRGKDGRRHVVSSRMVGSLQAPLGVRAPVLLQLAQEEEQLLQQAVNKVMGA